MKKLLVTIIIVLLISVIVSASLSDETLKEVEKLESERKNTNELLVANFVLCDPARSDEFLKIWVNNGKFFVETQDGKWFIGMKKIEYKEMD